MFTTHRRNNIITKTDSYKLLHWAMYPPGTTHVYSYFESRNGARFPETVFAGLQYILKEYLVGKVVTKDRIEWAAELTQAHLGNRDYFNFEMWNHILKKYGGRLPIRIKAVQEGTPVPVSNALLVIENLDDLCAPLTNGLESLLTHVWHASTVASLSRETFKMIKKHLEASSDNLSGLKFMLHDFGYRGCSGDESSSVGGFGHLINGLGTDTVPAIEIAHDFYNANLAEIAYSVPATEHSIMTSMGESGESFIIKNLLDKFPRGILSVVADSYDIYRFVGEYVCKTFKDRIMTREPDANGNCAFVVRPDSISQMHKTPAEQVVWILQTLWSSFSGHVNNKSKLVLDKHVRVLWGDGIDKDGINEILTAVVEAGFSAENMVFGMGGGLLQKINRDTQRSAFKSCAQKRGGMWHDIQKKPLDPSKISKKGRLKLVRRFDAHAAVYLTVPEDAPGEDLLETVFENGELHRDMTLAQIRENAKL